MNSNRQKQKGKIFVPIGHFCGVKAIFDQDILPRLTFCKIIMKKKNFKVLSKTHS